MDWLNFVAESRTVKVKKHPWMDECSFTLGTNENLKEIIDHCLKHPRVATDLETTGLDTRVFNGTTVDKIVGLCLCPDGKTGYYIPLRHKTNEQANVSWPLFVEQFQRLVQASLDGKLVFVFHGGQFDMEFLEFNGDVDLGGACWDKPDCWDDTEIEVYMVDSRRRDKRLKTLSDVECGITQLELDDLWTDEEKKKPGWTKDFSTLDPLWEGTLLYGGGDGIATWRLDAKFHPRVMEADKFGQNFRKIYKIEKACVAATRWMKRNRIKIDRAKVIELIKLGQTEWFSSIMAVYESAQDIIGRDVMPGYYKELRDHFIADDMLNLKDEQIHRAKGRYQRKYPNPAEQIERIGPDGKPKTYPYIYDVNAPVQLGTLFEEMGVPGLTYTEKSGQVKTSKDVLDQVVERAGKRFPFMSRIKRFREVHKALSNYLMPMLQEAEPSDDTIAINFRGHKVDTGRFATPSGKKTIRGWPKLNLQSLPAGYDPNRPDCMRRLRECIIGRDGKVVVACVAEGSLVPTGRGLVAIEKMRPGDIVRTEEGMREVTEVTDNGRQKVVCIRTSKGFSIRVTPEHLIRTISSDGFIWKPADELQAGDWVVQVASGDLAVSRREDVGLPPGPKLTAKEMPIRVPSKLIPELGEMLGRFIGDGHLGRVRGKPRSLNFALGDDVGELLPQLNEMSKRLFGVEFTHSAKGDVSKWSSPLARWWLEVSEKTGTKELKIPALVWASPSNVQAAFLRGLFDADGSVGARPGDGVSLWATSDALASGIQILLLEFGVHAMRKFKVRETNFGHQEGWLITVSGIRSLSQYGQHIGFSTARKKERLALLLQTGRNRDISEFFPLELAKKAVLRQRHPETNRVHVNGHRNGRVSRQLLSSARKHSEDIDEQWMSRLLDTALCYDTVISVEKDGEAQVYDIRVPGVRHFQANGLIVHNCDYAGVELRLVTNLSREPKWLPEYFHCSTCDRKFDPNLGKVDGKGTPEPPPPRCPNCGSDKIGDLHTLTALTVYGNDAAEKPEWKMLRQRAKMANFALCYGGGGAAVSRSTGCNKNEGWRIKNLFDGNYKTLRSWWGAQHAFARQREYVLTAFGRKYPVPDINHENGMFRSKAERNSVNGPIQGSSADITKMAMALVYREIKKRGWLDKALMVITMHDELVFEIDLDILEEAIEVIKHIMCRNPIVLGMQWPIPLTSDVEIGHNWSVPWDLNSMRAGDVKFQGDTKYYKPKQAEADGHVWDDLLSFPAVLAPHFKHKTFERAQAALDPAKDTTPPSGAPDAPLLGSGGIHEATAAKQPPSGLKKGSVFTYTLSCPLELWSYAELAYVIAYCRNGGTRVLRMVTREGVVLNDLPEWAEFVSKEPLLVNDRQFWYLAQSKGL